MKASDVVFAVFGTIVLVLVAFAISFVFSERSQCLDEHKVCVQTTDGYMPYPPEGTENE